MGETDISFRHLIRDLPAPFLRLVFPHHALEPLGPLDPSVDRPRQLTSDSLFRVRSDDREAAIHVEIEREWRPEMPGRLFDYASAAVTATRLPVSSIVVLLRPGGQPPRGTSVYRVPDIEGDAFVFRYHVVPLWQLDAHEMRAQLGLEAAPLCVAMRGADETFVKALAAEVVAGHGLAAHDQRSATRLLFYVSAAILGADAVRRIFHMESIIQDPNVQELIREWKDEGRVEGRVEGRAEAARMMLRTVLAARSFQVTPDVHARIDSEPDVARITSWVEAAVNAGSFGDVFRDD